MRRSISSRLCVSACLYVRVFSEASGLTLSGVHRLPPLDWKKSDARPQWMKRTGNEASMERWKMNSGKASSSQAMRCNYLHSDIQAVVIHGWNRSNCMNSVRSRNGRDYLFKYLFSVLNFTPRAVERICISDSILQRMFTEEFDSVF